MLMKRLSSIFSFLALALAPATAQQSAQSFRNPALPMEKRIDNLLSLMTLDEKIDCLGTKTGVPRLGVPNIGSSEGIHGLQQRGGGRPERAAITTTQFPQPPGMGESWDPELVREAGGVEGYEARFITQTEKYNRQTLMLWGPQADLARDPRWGRSEEVYGEDPFFNGTMVVAFTKGLQGDDPKYWQSAALLKHFLGNSNEDFRTSSSSNFDQRLFWEYYSECGLWWRWPLRETLMATSRFWLRSRTDCSAVSIQRAIRQFILIACALNQQLCCAGVGPMRREW